MGVVVGRVSLVGSPAAEPNWHACREVARTHGRTFYFASQLLPPEHRRAIHAAYAWCRVADDVVDRAPATGLAAAASALDRWEAELDAPVHPISVAFATVRAQYDIPHAAARDLIAGVRSDLYPRRFRSWAELEHYCYAVAGTVGLIVAPILGCRDVSALPHAIDLGKAMQLTNILRDVGEDARMGRLYLPLDELAAFGCDPEAILNGRPNGRFRDLMEFEIARARALYDSSRNGVPALSPAGQLAVLASAHLYGKILTRIEEQGYDVFAYRAQIPNGRKLRSMPVVAAMFVRLYLPTASRFRD